MKLNPRATQIELAAFFGRLRLRYVRGVNGSYGGISK